MVSMERLEHLPEKFAFKLDELGKRWIRETFESSHYDNNKEGLFFNFPNYHTKSGFKEGCHLLPEVDEGYTLISTDQLFPQPQIPTIEKGVKMLVWLTKESLAVEREVMFFDGKHYYSRSTNKLSYVPWPHAKPIPTIPEYTIEEAEQKFNIKIKQ